MRTAPDLAYPAILDQFAAHNAEGRAESRAFLAWFLEHYYRLEQLAAQDAVCDGPGDKGIDGIYVDDNLERIDVFQARLLQNPEKSIGERPLRELVGSVAQFDDADAVQHLAETTGNNELRSLLQSENVAAKLTDGYEVRGVFITNGNVDANGLRYVAGNDQIGLLDAEYLRNGYVPVGPTEPVPNEAEFDVSGFDVIQYKTPEATVLVAPVLASDLVRLNGIEGGELFDWNVIKECVALYLERSN